MNPCLNCGACCACYRVSFYWAEAQPNGHVPEQLTVPVTPHRIAMLGTNQPRPRCVALLGDVGEQVRCSIYARRPTPCRDLKPSWSEGIQNEQCDKARTAWGLPPLEPPQPTVPNEPTIPDGDLPRVA